MSRVRITGIDVGQDDCKSAPYGEQISTQGLATCIGVVAYGKYGASTSINKVMAHSSPGNESYVIGNLFVSQVQSSGMEITGIAMSCATRTVNDDGPFRLSDQDLREAIAAQYNISPSQVTNEQIETQRSGLRRQLDTAEAAAIAICRDQLGHSPTVYRRANANAASPYPYGTIVATASPKGSVNIEGRKVARIPDSAAPAPAASSGGGNYDNSYDYGGGSASYGAHGYGGGGSGGGSGSGGGGGYGGGGGAYARGPSGGNMSTRRPPPSSGPSGGGSGNGASRRDGGAPSRPTTTNTAPRRDGPSARTGSTTASQAYAASAAPRRDGPSSRTGSNPSRPAGNYTNSTSKPSGSAGSTGTARVKTSGTRRYEN